MLIVSFHNDSTGDEVTGNYDVSVHINFDQLWSGRIEGHDRRDGWQGLVRLLAKQTEEVGKNGRK